MLSFFNHHFFFSKNLQHKSVDSNFTLMKEIQHKLDQVTMPAMLEKEVVGELNCGTLFGSSYTFAWSLEACEPKSPEFLELVSNDWNNGVISCALPSNLYFVNGNRKKKCMGGNICS